MSFEEQVLAQQSLPKHVAIIMDGNGRWAQQQGKPRVWGHKNGVESVRESVRFCHKLGIQSLTLFAFSSENWRRPEEEVSTLMELFIFVLSNEVKKLHKNNVKLKVVGDKTQFSSKLQQKIKDAEALTATNTGLTLNIAANYGGQWDIVQAAQQAAQQVADGVMSVQDINESSFSQFMNLSDQPQLDLLIRTGGDYRISNFLLWQAAYAELYFTEVLWPDFNEDVFSEAVATFVSRERRFGCTGGQIKALMQQES
ncbi:polyprenyl diphosphate synthase [Flocculibacter collagenilyticus]|uniref:polyprenyl diphosphate synthase n=1 Tax=Flocculibacter collagenilyticus TaxID=2744479 RepID=UPI0018F5D9B8|nr:polyprenyl diphosphate synthase [Flocculibacter collagenilyticus]